MMKSPSTTVPTSLVIFLLTSLILLRVLVGFHPHSGQDNHHGKEDAYGGDYEAQRHWMELTLHLPIGDWYRYDLQYWGLDYPPLTAYHSYLCGLASHYLVGPESVELDKSRAYEDVTHKSFMRGTVLVFDVLLYFTAVWKISQRLHFQNVSEWLWTVVLALAQPAIILIDHGHFQYNTISLGLALWSFHFMTLEQNDNNRSAKFSGCVYGSILFCGALNFKQMSLYYAPAVFAYLLGRCASVPSFQGRVGRFCLLGITVIVTFAVLWWPFALHSPQDTIDTEISEGPFDWILHIVRRLFPFERGLFEGKVSNIWCALSTKPFSIRRRIPQDLQPMLALLLTLVLIIPPCVALFSAGQRTNKSHVAGNKGETENGLRMILWGSTSTSLAFFLASFQVHEKSIMMALSPLSLIVADSPMFISWFSLVAVWTLWPLLQVDRLQVAYVTCTAIFVSLLFLYGRPVDAVARNIAGSETQMIRDLFNGSISLSVVLSLSSLFLMTLLHMLEIYIEVPTRLPDLFPVLWSILGCGFFVIAWSYSCLVLLRDFFSASKVNSESRSNPYR
uniref:Alpha-1,3-glucosyltransferase n=1 Tax=Ditylum brightwellii TaxID=49249 RepID=A0A7S1ZDU1_9STRA|mmetsp:Transcript_2970/g.4540  ORF Transcript_2970/g.4540 Transcript_2970/m.4540 type:complete len:561 (+) Transcript_2970:318-2000(+)